MMIQTKTILMFPTPRFQAMRTPLQRRRNALPHSIAGAVYGRRKSRLSYQHPHRGRLSALEMDTDNSAVQDLILAAENEPEIKIRHAIALEIHQRLKSIPGRETA
jgi:hypothetical protein